MDFDNDQDKQEEKEFFDPKSKVKVETFTDEQVFDLTQSVRAAIVKNMTSKSMPTDPEDIAVLSSVMDSMDKQVIQRGKLKVEEQKAATDDEIKSLLAAVITRPEMNLDQINSTRKEPKDVTFTIPEDLPEFEEVPGLVDTVQEKLNYDQIMDGVTIPDGESQD